MIIEHEPRKEGGDQDRQWAVTLAPAPHSSHATQLMSLYSWLLMLSLQLLCILTGLYSIVCCLYIFCGFNFSNMCLQTKSILNSLVLAFTSRATGMTILHCTWSLSPIINLIGCCRWFAVRCDGKIRSCCYCWDVKSQMAWQSYIALGHIHTVKLSSATQVFCIFLALNFFASFG